MHVSMHTIFLNNPDPRYVLCTSIHSYEIFLLYETGLVPFLGMYGMHHYVSTNTAIMQ